MPHYCVAYGCYNKQGSCEYSFHRFPADKLRRKQWEAAVKREGWRSTEYSRLCGAHFVEKHPSDDKTHVDYIPTLFSHVPSPQKRKQQKKLASHERMVKRKRVMQANMEKGTPTDEVASTSQSFTENQSTMVDSIQLQGERVKRIFVEGQLKDLLEKKEEVERELEQVKKEAMLLKKELEQARHETEHAKKQAEQCSSKVELLMAEMERLQQNELTMEALEKSNEKVLFFTGLPKFTILKMVYELAVKVLPNSQTHGNRALGNFSEFLVTLMKLRLNLKNKDLAYRFGVCESVITHTIHKWLSILYKALNFLIRWPDRDELRKTIPECFRGQFDKVVVIIDCTEVYIERATNVLARSQTWSNYKSHNTVKYLIGITPQGTVSFVSEGWGGRVSDKAITKESGILNKLLPGDMVMADRGFNIADLVAEYRAEAVLPAFTRGKTQLSAKEVLQSRAVARVRIHVERLIDMVKQKYTILDGLLPLSFIKNDQDSMNCDKTTVDKLIVICCALVNLCESIVPID